MADSGDRSYEVGYGKPPRETQFKPGACGNPKGRPRGAKNFVTALEAELQARVLVTENGRRRKLSKREVIAKRLVNRAAEGDLKAVPLLLNEIRPYENPAGVGAADEIFGGPEHQPVIDGIVQRIRAASEAPASPKPDSDHPPREEPGGDPTESAE